MSWFLAAFGIFMLVLLHEFGHFVVAKRTGMRVERFSIGFGPLIAKVRRGETEYGIAPIPLGGYVKITGMNPEEKLPPEVAPRAYYAQPVWKRIVVILAGPAMNVLIAFVLLFGLAFGASKISTKVFSVADNAPAKNVLQPGDGIVSVDGKRGPPDDVEQRLLTFRRQIARHKCPGVQRDGCLAATPVLLRVERDGRVVTLRVRPRYDAQAKRMLLGIGFGEPRDPSVPEAARIAVDQMWYVTTATVTAIARIFNAEDRKQISGIVGSYEVTRQSFAQDIRRALLLIAIISLSLALFNLFPFLPLDGGHVFWSLVEKVRGRRVPYRVMEQASVVGFMLVLALAYIGLSNDIGRLTGGGFDTR